MAQITDLNVTPYYDDFDETDQFHKILFRPGLAVQARELTQLQSILQNQIEIAKKLNAYHNELIWHACPTALDVREAGWV